MISNQEAVAQTVAHLSEKEKDYIARMILAVVEEVGRMAKGSTGGVRHDPGVEPTGVGYLDADVRDYVLKRSA